MSQTSADANSQTREFPQRRNQPLSQLLRRSVFVVECAAIERWLQLHVPPAPPAWGQTSEED
jgi:hypothetical protein